MFQKNQNYALGNPLNLQNRKIRKWWAKNLELYQWDKCFTTTKRLSISKVLPLSQNSLMNLLEVVEIIFLCAAGFLRIKWKKALWPILRRYITNQRLKKAIFNSHDSDTRRRQLQLHLPTSRLIGWQHSDGPTASRVFQLAFYSLKKPSFACSLCIATFISHLITFNVYLLQIEQFVSLPLIGYAMVICAS